MKGLKIVLVVGIACVLSSAPSAVAPWPSIVHWLGVFGYPAPPDHPLVIYCVRLASLAFALIGVFFLVLATDPVRYRPMLVIAVCGLLLTAAVALATGLHAQMQPRWYLGDFAGCLVAAVLILALYPRGVEKEAGRR